MVHSQRSKDSELGGFTWGFPPDPSTNQHTAQPLAKRLCPQLHGTPPETDKRRRVDRILVPPELVPNLEECYPTFLAFSDHKAFVLSLRPNLYSPKDKRAFVPTFFLSDPVVVKELKEEISNLSLGGIEWWSKAQEAIRSSAACFHKGETCEGLSEVGACVMSSTTHRVCAHGWAFLRDKGLTPQCHSHAYSMLCSFGDKEWADRSG